MADNNQDTPSDFKGFGISFASSMGIGALFLAAFCLLRTRDKNIYAPKTYMVAHE